VSTEKEQETKQNDLLIDGGQLTPEEQKAADELAAHGSGDTDAGAAGDAAKGADEAKVETDAAADATKGDAGDAGAAAAAAGDDKGAARVEVPDPKPEAGRDFDAERKAIIERRTALADQLKAGTIDEDERDAALDKISDELEALANDRATFGAKLAVWEDRQARTAAAATSDFNAAALAWEKQNAAFMSNPIRRDAMQRAIIAIDTAKPGLSAADLLKEAEAVAFEAFNYTPTGAAAADKAVADATRARATDPTKVPTTVRDAPAAAGIDPGRSSFASLDEMGISDLEDAVARLPRDKVDAFLRDAPGANTRGE